MLDQHQPRVLGPQTAADGQRPAEPAEPGGASEPQVRSAAHLGMLAVIALAAILAAAVFSLSDRAPFIMREFFDLGERAIESVEYRLSLDIFDRDAIPYDDYELSHLLGWAATMMACGLALRDRVTPAVVAVALFAFGVAIEFGQDAFTSTRGFELKDITLNGLGLIIGLSVVVVLLGLRSLAIEAMRRLNP